MLHKYTKFVIICCFLVNFMILANATEEGIGNKTLNSPIIIIIIIILSVEAELHINSGVLLKPWQRQTLITAWYVGTIILSFCFSIL